MPKSKQNIKRRLALRARDKKVRELVEARIINLKAENAYLKNYIKYLQDEALTKESEEVFNAETIQEEE